MIRIIFAILTFFIFLWSSFYIGNILHIESISDYYLQENNWYDFPYILSSIIFILVIPIMIFVLGNEDIHDC